MSDKPKTKPPRVRLYDEDELPAIPVHHGRVERLDRVRPSPNQLSVLESNFVYHFTTDYIPVKAALKAGYPPSRMTGKRPIWMELLEDRRIQEEIAEVERDRLSRIRIDGDYLLAKFFRIATAEPSDIITRIIPCCRYCWGENHQYQRTHGEFEEDYDAYLKLSDKKKRDLGPFDEKGGAGYNPKLHPNADCPNCFGDGDYQHPVVIHCDTRFMTPSQRALYAGAEQTKDGHKTLLKDQNAAINFIRNVAERLLEQQRQRSVKQFDWEDMSEDELRQIINQGIELGLLEDEELDQAAE